ncbi:hypothetical protein FZU01_11055 [Salmonella enterica subsp. enterica]|nr:hypothetical protein [Salmonella enterica]EBW9330068.1 hypothetical protein [Salmonella enterica subsp. enterica serovar Arechavaleta]ECQ6564362.1 hypothetical protein [Salmonella enterica subsp. enterica serovar Kintambo]EDL7129722.1 hypothetical protein [Salmonella enterica subsp. enterica serovar Infantis]EED8761679.1 hypothetical protein [Salmonella enterica subsp. enterica serovar Fulica]
MNELEYEKLFSFNKSSNKYKIELTKAIKFLLSKQRVIEAKHHFSELERINPNHKIVMELGFELGIKTFDMAMSAKYHNLLNDNNKYNQHDLALKRIIYYLSINDKKNASSNVVFLLDDMTLDKDRLLKLYNLIYHELNEEYLLVKANDVLKKRNLRISKG